MYQTTKKILKLKNNSYASNKFRILHKKKLLAPKFNDNFLFLIRIILQFSKILDTTRNYICEIINLSIFFCGAG